jgi:circadian clock protein KaiC
MLEVRKTRGHGHIRGKHPLKITNQGIEVFPHLLPESFEEVSADEKVGEPEKISSGVSGLDSMLGGGYVRGSSVIVAGMPGTFKSTVGIQFLADGAKQGERGLLVTFGENPKSIVATMKSKGVDISPFIADGTLVIRHYFPKTFYMDELIATIEEEIKEHGLQRVVFDGINEIERSIPDPAMIKDYASSIGSLLGRNSITSLYTYKLDKFTGNAPLTDVKYASLVDSIVYIGAVEIESAMHKVISVLKMRGSDFSADLREIKCGENGLHVSDKFVGMSNILGGNPQGQYKKTVEQIFQPLLFLKDFINIAADDSTEDSQRVEILKNLNAEVNKLAEQLEDYFDIRSEQ